MTTQTARAGGEVDERAVDEVLYAVDYIRIAGLYENRSGATGHNNGTVSGGAASNRRYRFSSSRTFEYCETRYIFTPERRRDSGSFRFGSDSIRLYSDQYAAKALTFDHDSNFNTLTIDGANYVRITDQELCD